MDLEAMWAYWAVVAAVMALGDETMAYSLAYVSAASTVAVNLTEAREAVRLRAFGS